MTTVSMACHALKIIVLAKIVENLPSSASISNAKVVVLVERVNFGYFLAVKLPDDVYIFEVK